MIRDVVVSQKNELEQKLRESFVKRRTQKNFLENDLIKVIIGPRRSGKSFFGQHLAKSLGNFGYCNFDDERLVNLPNFDELLAAVDSVYGDPKNLLFDEIQNIEKWELLLNRLHRQGRNLIVTGSNAHLLSSELATHLTGRHLPIVLFPFSFNEYVSALALDHEQTGAERGRSFQEYMTLGGFPEPLVKKMDRSSYLSTLLDSVLFKDIVKRRRIRSAEGINDLALYLLSNNGCEYSGARLAGLTKCKSHATVEKFIGYLEEAFLFFPLRRFSYKVREQTKFNRKVYCVDNGFVGARGFSGGANTGRLAEAATAVVLHRQELEGRHRVYFWKNVQQQEVDFVIFRNNAVQQLIQVSWNLDDPKTFEREVRTLVMAGEELSCGNLMLLTESREAVQEVSWFGRKGTVVFRPLWKWMAEQD